MYYIYIYTLNIHIYIRQGCLLLCVCSLCFFSCFLCIFALFGSLSMRNAQRVASQKNEVQELWTPSAFENSDGRRLAGGSSHGSFSTSLVFCCLFGRISLCDCRVFLFLERPMAKGVKTCDIVVFASTWWNLDVQQVIS